MNIFVMVLMVMKIRPRLLSEAFAFLTGLSAYEN
jgi:hypothetical protein